ncbi:MAG: hypothetical protein JWN07_79 [Hyphomicrobiales bacterium]|nr:hypothetical protein [Hyphomicrobiales bacterium]
MNRNLRIGLALALIVVIIAVAYGRFGERIHNQDVNATSAVVTDQGIKTDTPQRETR